MKHRLKHPIRAIREPIGKAGLAVAILALVFAMVGGAWAAAGLTGKQKKEVTKIAKKYAGAPGAAGPAGPTGPKGDTGAAGTAGKDGDDGTNGTNGVSPTGTQFSVAKGGCTEGGVEFKGANTTFACNGVKGADGQTGFTETLPSGKTESGAWSVSSSSGDMPYVTDSISFVIPYPAGPAPTVNYVQFGDTDTDCPGNVNEPDASPGNLCIFEFDSENESFPSAFQSEFTEQLLNSSGVTLAFAKQSGGTKQTLMFGSWAVTAP